MFSSCMHCLEEKQTVLHAQPMYIGQKKKPKKNPKPLKEIILFIWLENDSQATLSIFELFFNYLR